MPCLASVALCMLLSSTLTAQVQSSKQALKDFSAAVLGNKFLVRGFSDDPKTTLLWDGTILSFDDPKLHTLGVIKPDSIEMQGSKLNIAGNRQTLIRDKDGTLKLAGGSPAIIVIDMTGADLGQAIPALKAALFFPTPQDAFAALPAEYASLIKTSPNPKDLESPTPPVKKQECTVKHPSILYAPVAEFSEQAKQAHFSGTVSVMLTVGEDGIPRNAWIIRPAGLGLDQKAGEAALRYKFRPATCDGKPVETTLYMEVNFKVL